MHKPESVLENEAGSPCGDALCNHIKRFRTPVALLRSLLDKYPWQKYKPFYPSSSGLNSATTVIFLRMALALNNLQKLICH